VVNPDRIRERKTDMMKKDVDRLWGNNPEKVFRIYARYDSWRCPPKYGRIVGKKAQGYLVDILRCCDQGDHAENGKEDRLPEWRISKSEGKVWSCKEISTPWGSEFDGMTLEQVAEVVTAESVAEWHEEQRKLQVKPLAIAEILTRTTLRERDLQATPEAVLVALRDALTRDKVGA
jgi:hypothetical protein